MIYYFYKIVCDDVPDYSYVGSTKAFANRKYEHKHRCNNENCKEYNYKLYKTIRDNGGWDNWRMVCIHQGEYPDKRSAEIKEEELRVQLNANMNTIRCYTSEDQKKEYDKEYYSENKEQIKERVKEYYEQNKERVKEYYEQNKDKINERRNKKCECECGGRYTNASKSKHLKTKLHKKYLKENVNE